MIKDVNNCREVHFGYGTVGISPTIDCTQYVMVEKDYEQVGEKTVQMHPNTIAQEIPNKSVVLKFEGKDAIKSIDMIIEDLTKIKEKVKEILER